MRTLAKLASPPEIKVEIDGNILYRGDCLEILKTLPSNSVDAIVTDPPAGINFMGKEWDQAKLGRDKWIDWLEERMKEALRVLKPGGHALVWALPRTSHWTATACEDAGFEIRDRVSHLFGTGFPKNMDVSKAIDKAAGKEREIIGPPPYTRGRAGQSYSETRRVSYDYPPQPVTAPATPEAAQWEGWGTALKPACEDWWLCRKPLEGTVAANVLKYGTGAINIDGCRVEFQGETDKSLAKPAGRLTSHGKGHLAGPKDAQDVERSGFEGEQNAKGRFPANLIHDGSDEVLEGFPESNSARANGNPNNPKRGKNHEATSYGQGDDTETNDYRDTGSASRFFYCTKASKKDRNEGGVTNKHPTVKNTELMRYLCRLITPPGGTVLDMFAGSFSTGKAAVREGFRFIGIEAEQEYFDIGVQRIRHEVSQI